ncbi:AlbA family DNA-binding domain-containing protein [Mesorhizobium opportunistum]|uniref:Transcriptional regulator n=1 Tax=Mesorhizobium opportunistum (strain LMG 24607 / HAMBI 3007 / WSM2075) TaxID=536019 RepID=F7YG32_MESOW|nr:ATP-binding protein [Mesorhizobium opportunistum]AEH89144.1 putative transcriptional regulator [Mesorhizobium opportunistum WSM2075]
MEFDDIISGKEAFLREAILLETQEGLRLDFKAPAVAKQGAAFTPQGQLTKDGRSSLAKALSAFSNSAGGVLVIGVECRKNTDGVDCACDLEPLPNWKTALSAVSSAVGDLLQPKNDGIRVEAFASEENQSLGYVIVDVPRSERRPHRSEATDLKQYFKRSGSGSYAMEHYDIEDAFRRVAVPSLELRLNFTRRMVAGSEWTFEVSVFLENTSRVTAFFPSLTVWNSQGSKYDWYGQVLDTALLRDGGRTTAHGNSEFVIHPGTARQIATWRFVAKIDDKQEAVTVGGAEPHMARLEFDYLLTARDVVAREQHMEFPLFPLRWPR